MRRALRWTGAILCVLCGLASFYLAMINLDKAGGRGGLIVLGALFLFLAARLIKPA